MFTGIIEETGTVEHIGSMKGGKELTIACSFAGETQVDESISVNGVCLTVVSQNGESFRVQCVEETLRKTSFGGISKGDIVNLERSLTLDKAIEGHIVQGHVDSTGTIIKIENRENDRLLTIEYPESFTAYLVGRGSIAVDGISLTVAREQDNYFTVAIIPYTWEHTNMKDLREGDTVNLEYDIFGKYIVRYMEKMQPGSGGTER